MSGMAQPKMRELLSGRREAWLHVWLDDDDLWTRVGDANETVGYVQYRNCNMALWHRPLLSPVTLCRVRGSASSHVHQNRMLDEPGCCVECQQAEVSRKKWTLYTQPAWSPHVRRTTQMDAKCWVWRC